ncbi:hypothetical protein LF1_00570 [Rubripirellula obstinata]|uniref:Uncharacterized protein n=1 Tax=Rubripirellula obstinata TaxID=406547 RepID=A0A5B1CD79_9BACT|nr:hypothetical protein LF1_00570 [Rubripirellula obstinata]
MFAGDGELWGGVRGVGFWPRRGTGGTKGAGSGGGRGAVEDARGGAWAGESLGLTRTLEVQVLFRPY